ncbi:hypothetical protein SDC9_124528 [bioreactor metagenome]|uniref:Uncharacterized protein n=1 Tax=bioreactor metagenome TaxID=1076179 RepID=A0A645CL84_9ZZZZ
MLKYLDRYPIELPCRYSNKVACFNLVYIVSNIYLIEQYTSTQRNESETFKAFIRRIHQIEIYTKKGIETFTTSEYLERGHTKWKIEN